MMAKIKLLIKTIVPKGASITEVISLYSMIGTILLMYFPISYLLSTGYNNLLNSYTDFASITIYLSFITTIIFILCTNLPTLNKSESLKHLIKITVIWLAIFLIYYLSIDNSLRTTSIYYFLRLSCVLLFGYSVYKSEIWLRYKHLLSWTLLITMLFQSLILVTQFTIQKSLGLSIIGESPLSSLFYGVAKIVTETGTYIRGYGTFPHPNILGAFLAISSIINLYLLTKNKQYLVRYLLIFMYFINIISLLMSFSRASFLVVSLGTLFFLIMQSFGKSFIKILRWFWFVPIAFIISTSLLYPLLQHRTQLDDRAIIERSLYNHAGISIIQNYPILGTGAGTNMFHMKQELENRIEAWDIQPIHNYPLLIISELGILGLVILIFSLYLLYRILRKSLPNLYQQDDNIDWMITLTTLGFMILGLFWFDHYFYTNWSAQLLLWIILGLIAKSTITIKNDKKV